MSLDKKGNLLLYPLLEIIEREGFQTKGHIVSYYSDNDKAFVHVGKWPILSTVTVELHELNP